MDAGAESVISSIAESIYTRQLSPKKIPIGPLHYCRFAWLLGHLRVAGLSLTRSAAEEQG